MTITKDQRAAIMRHVYTGPAWAASPRAEPL